MTTPETRTANDMAVERTDLAVRRTVMAADRNLMAWIRTALSMISFGFTIYKVLEGFLQGGAALPHAGTPRNIGLFLTGLGTLSMLMGTLEYWQTLKDLRSEARFRFWRPSMIIALVMSVTGVFLFLAIIAKLL